MKVTITVDSALGDITASREVPSYVSFTRKSTDKPEEVRALIQATADQALLAYPLEDD